MNSEINLLLTSIEVALLNAEKPEYLEVSLQNNFIYILVSKRDYKHYSLSERQKSLFKLLEVEFGDTIKYPVIIEAFCDKELDGLFKLYGNF